MSNYINITRSDCSTLAYGQNGNDYAKLFTCKSHIQNSSTYNRNTVIFSLYHYEGINFVYKKYYLTCKKGTTTDQIKFLDLTPGNTGIDLVYVNNDNEKIFYVKGKFSGAKIYMKIDFCNYPSYLNLYDCEKFNTAFDENNMKKATYISNNVLSESLDSNINVTADIATIKRTDNTCQLDIKFVTNKLNSAHNDVTLFNTIYAPKEEFTFPVLISDSDGYKTGRGIIYSSGNVKIFGITKESKVWIHTLYLI
jgi:hypothetical protein